MNVEDNLIIVNSGNVANYPHGLDEWLQLDSMTPFDHPRLEVCTKSEGGVEVSYKLNLCKRENSESLDYTKEEITFLTILVKNKLEELGYNLINKI